jgi:hypothetical protein
MTEENQITLNLGDAPEKSAEVIEAPKDIIAADVAPQEPVKIEATPTPPAPAEALVAEVAPAKAAPVSNNAAQTDAQANTQNSDDKKELVREMAPEAKEAEVAQAQESAIEVANEKAVENTAQVEANVEVAPITPEAEKKVEVKRFNLVELFKKIFKRNEEAELCASMARALAGANVVFGGSLTRGSQVQPRIVVPVLSQDKEKTR